MKKFQLKIGNPKVHKRLKALKEQTYLLFLRATKLATTSAERIYIGP